MTEIAFTEEELSVLINILERRKEELRNDDNGAYVRTVVKQILEKLDAEITG